jgi:hypothetical protein
MTKRSEIVAELHSLKSQLAASERRAKRATARSRRLEKLLETLAGRMKTWADSPLHDTANAPRLATVGECRQILAALADEEPPTGEGEEAPESSV